MKWGMSLRLELDEDDEEDRDKLSDSTSDTSLCFWPVPVSRKCKYLIIKALNDKFKY